MRSPGLTFLLALLAAALCALSVWQTRTGNFHAIFGKPATPVGQHLYPRLQADDVTRVEIRSRDAKTIFTRTAHGWMAEQPWRDRVDPRAAGGIIEFTRGMKVEDSTPLDKAKKVRDDLRKNGIGIILSNASGDTLARYSLGRQAPWKAEEKDNTQLIPTVFMRRMEENNKDYVYVVTGDINPMFKDHLRFLRDHHPFSFNPAALQKISLTSPEGILTLGRETPKSPWRIVKPLDLPTHATAVRQLIERLYELQAVEISDRTAGTLPAATTPAKATRISLQSFGSETETSLEILPPESPDATEALATVSDRPETIFSLPLKPEPGLVSLADLPTKLDELRDPALTRLNIAAIRGILIQSRSNLDVLITREPPGPWKATTAGQTFPANEENLFRLLKTMTTARALAFVSDAATDFTPWGLDRPFLTVRFLAADNQSIEIRFGMDGRGGFFANRLGTPTVVRVDELLIHSISARPYEWLPSRVWNLNRVHLAGIVREQTGQPQLTLKYDFNFESWSGQIATRDVSADIDGDLANRLLDSLENLKSARWLAADDAAARQALLTPSLKITVVEKTYNDASDFTGIASRILTLAPQGDPANPTAYFGRVSGSPHPFVLDSASYQKIIAPVTD